MGIFVGGSKNTSAVKCGLKINWMVQKALKPKAEAAYPTLKKNGFVIRHCTGIHTSQVLVVRGGVRGSNDLVFVGTAPNFAARLSEQRTSSRTYITHQIFNHMADEAKFGGSPRENMWSPVKISLGGEAWDCFASTWWWKP
jgi:class 3 adenylate cyclase